MFDPYEAPRASLVKYGEVAVSTTRRSRWTLLRWIPVIYFGLFAVICPLGVIIALCTLIWIGWTTRDPVVLQSRQFGDGLLIIPAYSLMGVLAYLTTRSWYTCRWKRAIALSVGFLVLISLGELCSGIVLKR